MPEYDLDPVFEARFAAELRVIADEGLVPFDAMEIAGAAMGSLGQRRSVMPGWARNALALALLVVALIGAGIAGGIIKLPSNELLPNPSFEPFSPAPFSPLPSAVGVASPGAASPVPTVISGSPAPSAPAVSSPPSLPPETVLPTETPAPNTPEPTALVTPAPTETPLVTIDPTATPIPVPLTVLDADTGDQVSCAVASDRQVYCWGSNNEGELGDGTGQDRFTANTPVVGIDDAMDVSAGIRFACAVRADGSVWCWGEDPGSDENLATPRQVPVIDDAIAVTAGGAHVCALRSNGGIWCWGLGQLGQLGNGEFIHNAGNPVPVEVDGIDDATQVSAGWNHTCAVRADQTVWCWGGNGDGATGYGQLGDGTLVNRPSPVQVVGIDGVVEIAGGGWSTCAIRNDGGAWCWGHGERGTLGNGEMANSSVPVQVANISDAEHIAVGFWHGCAARDVSVWCWGDIGWGGSNPNPTPVQGAGAVDAALMSTDRDLLVLDHAGLLWQWGFGNGDAPVIQPVGP